MAYYDPIAQQWHETTGHKGGAFKELVLNQLLLEKLPNIHDCSILELGAGNGYFLPLVLRHFVGQVPRDIVVSDQSERLLAIAKRAFSIAGARYECLDVGAAFPFDDRQFDLIIASMLFNEVQPRVFRNALRECCRVLSRGGMLLMAVTHPAFIDSLRARGLLKPATDGTLTMPGSGSLRLPVVVRSIGSYRKSLKEAGFQYEEDEAQSTPEVIRIKAGLRNAWKVPIALVYTCRKAN